MHEKSLHENDVPDNKTLSCSLKTLKNLVCVSENGQRTTHYFDTVKTGSTENKDH